MSFRCIYKHGDELLQDAMCIAAMKEMNNIFKEENVDAEVVLYEVKETMLNNIRALNLNLNTY